MKMQIQKNQLLFDMNNPNCKIDTAIQDISYMLKNLPVMCSEKCVGIIMDVTNITETQIFGTILFYTDDCFTDMRNYEMYVDNVSINPYIVKVKSMYCIIVKPKNILVV